jgi:hypothetical protein
MNGARQIKSKQKAWATRRNLLSNIQFPYYLTDVDNNIFGGLNEKTESEFQKADGGELKDTKSRPAKMKALHSSSALAVNIFQYWRGNNNIRDITAACGFCSKKNRRTFELEFERKYTIHAKESHHPNIDVVISSNEEVVSKIYAIECKMTEPFGSSHSEVSDEYLSTDSLWLDLPALKTLAQKSKEFKYLDVAQLIKHILGLMDEYRDKKKFLLMYLYYDVAGSDSSVHYKEIEKFKKVATIDQIDFRYLSYQELIVKLGDEYYLGNETYCNYIRERYL